MAATPTNESQTNSDHEQPNTAQQSQPSADEPIAPLFQAPDFSKVPEAKPQQSSNEAPRDDQGDHGPHDDNGGSEKSGNRSRRRRSRGGSGQNNTAEDAESHQSGQGDKNGQDDTNDDHTDQTSAQNDSSNGTTRRRRKRRRGNTDMEVDGGSDGDPENTVTRVRAPREAAASTGPEAVTSVKGSTRLEAKRQRRRDSRGQQRRRHVITEAEFLARRESVDRKMMVRQHEDRIQIAVLEDGVLAEHFVSNTTQDSMIGNVYLGKVQNVLPSMEAAFVDIGRGRNAVLYAGEVNWDAAQLDGKPKKIENALKSGDSVLVQVTKDPVGHKGARLTSQISMPGRYLVYVPGGTMTGISRKLPDVERNRLKKILKDHLPDNAGVIVRTAAEGTSEDELTNDINRLRAQWETIEEKSKSKKVLAPELLYAEPDLTIKVVRDVFNEDFSSMVVQGGDVWDNIEAYVTYVAPHLLERLDKWEPEAHKGQDLFDANRLDEQLNKALERKVNLPSGGSLVLDRTEAMTVVDVNTGKFTGSGGNLEETVTKNNLEAAEEIVRQLRLRDIGGIIVIDFIDMVLESNRDLVLRRLVECLGRDRTKHQVAEVTSLGLVQMTRKRMGTGLVEVFSEVCEHCSGRGIIIHETPVEHQRAHDSHGNQRSNKPNRRNNQRNNDQGNQGNQGQQQGNKSSNGDQQNGSRRSRRRKGNSDQSPQENSAQQEQNNQSSPDQDESTDERADRETRAEQTRAALANIAAASQISPSADDDDTSQTSTADGQQSQRAEKSDVVTASDENNDVPNRRGNRPRRSRRGSSTGQTEQGKEASGTKLGDLNSALDEVAEKKQQGSEDAERPSSRPRRRRAATSDAASEEITLSSATAQQSGEQGKSFSANSSASEQATEKEKPAAAPMMLGVGVSAQEISSPSSD